MRIFRPVAVYRTGVAGEMFGECLRELVASLGNAAEKHLAQPPDVQRCGALYLQLANVVLDHRAVVLQKQVACLKQAQNTAKAEDNNILTKLFPKVLALVG